MSACDVVFVARMIVKLFVFAANDSSPAPPDEPAVILNPSRETHAELTRALSRALRGVPITLADDALTGDSTLILERSPARGPDGLPLGGRETGRPEHFRLLKQGSRCVLVHEERGKRYKLSDAVECRPI